MHSRSLATRGLTAAISLFALAQATSAQVLHKQLFYTRFLGPDQNVRRADFTYDPIAHTTSVTNRVTITTTPGADGLLFAPDGDLIVGGQADAVHKVVVANGAFQTVTAGGIPSFHVMLDPSGTRIWTTGYFGNGLVSVPIAPFANGTAHAITGDDNQATHLVFAAGQAFYTVSQPTGVGNFGTIDLDTFTTTRIATDVLWAHGQTFDCYTGHVMAFGNGQVAQIDPVSHAVVSLLDLSAFGLELDQGTSDGEGHLFIAANGGNMLFLDITVSHLVGAPDFADAPFLDTFLDDIAPDCGLGAPPVAPHTIGYWKTHPAAWPVTSLTLGCQTYTQAQLLTLLNTPVRGDASINLAHQLIATKLNILVGSRNWPLIVPQVDKADGFLCAHAGSLPYGVPSGSAEGFLLTYAARQLDSYNNGF